MIHLIVGPKGSGKTKCITDRMQAAAPRADGNMVYINKGREDSWTIPAAIRLVDLNEFPAIRTYGELYALICGLLSGNYDITDVYVDSAYAICDHQPAELYIFLAMIQELCGTHHAEFTFTLSAKPDELPDEIFQMAEDVQFCS